MERLNRTNFMVSSERLLRFRRELVNDSALLRGMYEGDNMEVIESLPRKFNFVLLYKMYLPNYDFNEFEIIILIEQLNYLDNKYLDDILVLAKLKKSEYIENNLQDDIRQKYDEIVIESTAFETFLSRDNLDILVWIKNNEEVEIDESVFKYACKYSNTKVITWLYSFNTINFDTINLKNVEYSWKAAEFGNLEAMSFLISHGLQIREDSILLELASQAGQTEMVMLLLNYIVDHKTINNSLNLSIQSGTLKLVKYLIDFMLIKDITIKIDKMIILNAIEYGYFEVCKYLLDYIPFGWFNFIVVRIIGFRKNGNYKMNLELITTILNRTNLINPNLLLQTALDNKDLELFKLLLNYSNPQSLNVNTLFIFPKYKNYIVTPYFDILISYNMTEQLIQKATAYSNQELVTYIYENSPKNQT